MYLERIERSVEDSNEPFYPGNFLTKGGILTWINEILKFLVAFWHDQSI
jgi:hypothetical protein